MRRLQVAAALVLALAAGAPPSAAQTRATAEQALRQGASTRLVVRVTDAEGDALRPDTAGVRVRMGATALAVRRIDRAEALPRAVVFVVCHARAERPTDVAATLAAFTALADRLTRPGDRAALVACGDHAEIVSGWADPAFIRRALDGVRATSDEVDEAEALRLAATLPSGGLRRVAVVRTDGRHLDAATEADVARAGLPVFPLATAATTDRLPLVNLARSTGGALLDGPPADALAALLRRLDAAWLIDVDLAPQTSGAVSIRIGDASTRLASLAPPAASDSAALAGRPPATASPAPARPDRDGLPLGWIAFGAALVALGAGWVLLRRPSAGASDPQSAATQPEPEAISSDLAPAPGPEDWTAPVAPPSLHAVAAPPQSGPPAGPRVRVEGAGVDAILVLDRPRIIGRDPGADVVLADPSVSARHVSIEASAGQVVVRDLGSTNGLTVGGVRAPAAVLDGTLAVELGRTALVLTRLPTS